MPTAIDLIDEAIELGKQESRALTNGDIPLATELATRRKTLIASAWELRHQCDQKIYKAKLLQLKSVQEFLKNETTKQKDTTAKALSHSRKSTKTINGYKKAMNYTT